MKVEIVEKEFVKLKEPIIIEGFPSVGLVGAIATEYLANKMEMKEIGFIKSDGFPPITLVKEGIPKSPIRLYANEEFVVIVSDTAVPQPLSYEVARVIAEWAQQHSAKKVISLGGIAHEEREEIEPKVYSVSPMEKKLKELKKKKVEPVKLGFLTGVFGLLLMECYEKNIPSYGFLADAHLEYPDAGAAAKALDVLTDDLGIKLDVKPLRETSDKIEEKMSKLMEQTRRTLGEGTGDNIPSIYR